MKNITRERENVRANERGRKEERKGRKKESKILIPKKLINE